MNTINKIKKFIIENKQILFLSGIFLIAVIVSTKSMFNIILDFFPNLDNLFSFICAIILTICCATITSYIITGMGKPIDTYREYLLKELEKEASRNFTSTADISVDDNSIVDGDDDKVVDTKRTGENDIIAQMLDNNDEIKEYFKISKRHAKSSYRFSIISCIVGILMLGLAIYGVVVVNDLEVAIIGTISGAITEVISGTVLWIHNKSALQLNHYYNALHQNERFLSAINMADKLSNEKREEMYIEIIRRQIEIHNVEKTEVNE